MFIDGHIIVKRTIKERGWYHDHKVFALFMHLLIDANFKDCEWEERTVKRGQLVTTLQMLSNDTGMSIQEVRTCLKKLSASGVIRSETTFRRTIITICDYDSYQDVQQATNKEATIIQQPIIEERKKEEIKKPSVDVKEKTKRFVKPTVEEVRAYCAEKGYYDIDPDNFVNFYESKGWLVGKSPMKNWRACVATWVRQRKENGGLFQQTERKEVSIRPNGIKPQG